MKIVLTSLNSKYIHPNVALRILNNDLKNNNINALLKEYTIKEDIDKIVFELLDFDIVCWSCYIYNIELIKEINIRLKKQNPNVIIILGGPEVSYLNEKEANQLVFDYIICGEGEQVLVNLIKSIIDCKPFISDVIIYKNNNNLIMNNSINIVDINYAQGLCNDYYQLDIKNQIVYLETSRGCPYLCSYCQASLDNNVRNFSLDYIINLIDDVIIKKVKIVKFLDRTFNFDTKRTNTIIQRIIEKDNGYTTFQFEITGELLDLSSISLINNSRKGLFRLEIGIQSTNVNANRAIRRYQNFDKLKDIVNVLVQKNKAVLHLDLIAGLPYEDLSSFKKTFDDVYDLNVEELQLGFLKLLKGTHLNTIVDKYNYVFENNAPYQIVENKFLSKEDIATIKVVEDALEQISNHKKAKQLYDHLLKKYQYSYFDLFYEIGILIKESKQLYEIYIAILNSKLIKDDEDRIELIKNYYLLQKQKPKALTSINNKKEVLHRLIEKEGLSQNNVFVQSSVEIISEDNYYVYLFKLQKGYQIRKDR